MDTIFRGTDAELVKCISCSSVAIPSQIVVAVVVEVVVEVVVVVVVVVVVAAQPDTQPVAASLVRASERVEHHWPD